MSEVLMSLVQAVIPMLLTGVGGACGWLLKSDKREEAKDKTMEERMKTLLYN